MTLKGDGIVSVTTVAAAYYYAAEYPLPVSEVGSVQEVTVTIIPRDESFLVGILSPDRSRFLSQKTIRPAAINKTLTVSLSLKAETANGAILVITSGAEEKAATLDVARVTVITRTAQNYRTLGPGLVFPK